MTSNEPVEAEIVSDEPTKRKHNVKKYPKDTWSINRVFWGMLFVVIGSMMLASNFNIVEVNWMNLWKLWPLIVIAFGLSILSIRHWVWKLLSVLMILATMFAIVWVSVVGDIYSSNFETYSANIKVMSSNVKSAEVSVKAGASSINVNSNDQNSVAEASLTSNVANIKKSSTIKNNIQYVYLGMNPNKNSSWWSGNVKSNFDISFCRHLPILVNLDAGASDTTINLSQAQLTVLNIKSGASKLDIKFGNKVSLTKFNIESGVSSIVVKVPRSSGVQVKLDSGLTSRDMANLTKVSENYFESVNYSGSKNKIEISAKIGLSSFKIERY